MAKRGPKIKQFCIYGHDVFICGRDKNSGQCNDCKKEYQETHKEQHNIAVHKHYENNKEKVLAGKRKWKQEHAEEIKLKNKEYKEIHKEEIAAYNEEYNKEYREEHQEELLIKGREYYQKNREILIEKVKEYQEEHPEVMRRANLKNKLKRRSNIPLFGQEGIEEFYDAKPVGTEVDHIVPLCGKGVKGLHVMWNLQYLPSKLNRSKNSKCDLLDASIWYGKILEEAGLK
jgi:hypothetical protein